MRARGCPIWLMTGLLVSLGSVLVRARGDEPPAAPKAASPKHVPTPAPRPASQDHRLDALEAINREILQRLDRSEAERKKSEDRYRALEHKYDALLRRLESEKEPSAEDRERPANDAPDAKPPAAGPESDRLPGFHGLESLEDEPEEEWPLRATFNEGFAVKSFDDEYQLRFRLLDQTDFKNFVPGDQFPARSGLYIPRVRIYFEGQLTRLFDYEVSIQRSVEGVWDLLDGNVDINIDRRFRVRFGRTLVPYSYDWFDHLEQFFITPERSLFPLNFGLSRSAGLLAHGRVFDDRLQYAVGGFDGHITGLADDNTTRDAVGYLNLKPFLESERFPLLRDLNVGASGFLGQQISPRRPLPLRTSLQSSDNDEAAQAASSIFLDFSEDAAAFGGRSAGAIHLAWYGAGFSLEAEWQGGRNQFIRKGLNGPVSLPVSGNHFTLAYFVTGEVVRERGMVTPLRPFDPVRNSWGPGAIELFARYSRLSLGETVFTAGIANPEEWTRDIDLYDVGLNWYLTRYIKIYFDWQHSAYGSPVLLNPSKGLYGRDNDLFWIRGQLYY